MCTWRCREPVRVRLDGALHADEIDSNAQSRNVNEKLWWRLWYFTMTVLIHFIYQQLWQLRTEECIYIVMSALGHWLFFYTTMRQQDLFSSRWNINVGMEPMCQMHVFVWLLDFLHSIPDLVFQRAFNATMVVHHLRKKTHATEEEAGDTSTRTGEGALYTHWSEQAEEERAAHTRRVRGQSGLETLRS